MTLEDWPAPVGLDPGRPYALLADIHANQEALEVVEAWLDRRGLGQALVLGDQVGYGASPQQVLDRLRQRGWPMLRGNHEDMLRDFSIVDARGMLKKRARRSIEWTREALGPEQVAELADLPRSLRPAPDVLAVHGSLVDPNFCYAYIYDLSLDLNVRRLHELATPPGTLVLHGHTHWPKVFRVTDDGEWQDLKVGEGQIELDREARYFVNPGSVGHPRDGDPRASLMAWDPAHRRLELVRLEYDIEATLERIRAAGYSEEIVERWSA